ncbi:alanyl-tRNA synthetase [Dictyostelium purpureum]|uniref:Alanine--tRNA ligase n=1 Tax=Dictyostelium purpureum TaxID=5786 RepID=F0ZCZ1_DICPU|nr:alanyl-tRNA synthetase [Dictyostelium purpureum]EGC38151.1 alanyl-tRNA synthetase [Dictyostelium purpureum]|eukprot:XP_003285278.1 alanyl-tRNA synthetase [Dictyostelium purpureum]
MDVNQIRKTFIEFFVNKAEHTFVPSSAVIPHDDPTLLFANAGMNQFKPIFLGQVNPKSEQAKLKRAVNSQKCIRAGGKHNDLDDVGKDTYHHTFFEMLGNWSFGNYFKKEAISWAWELLTEVYGLDKERLYVTYFRGDPEKGLEPDNEAKNLWLQYLPEERVLPFGMKENFWEMGDQGPCGPCSEIHYDKVPGRNGAPFVNADDPTLIEIWNLVFIQFNREADKSLRPLPNKHVDTGMGLERLTSIIQKVPTNYDTDVFKPIFEAIQEVTGYPEPYGGKVGAEDSQQVDMAYRVIADHIRTLSFSIADGAAPSVDGRGQVLRRILRRAVRYGKQKLNAPAGFFSKLVDVVVQNFGEFYPELRKKPEHIRMVLTREEDMFNKTLEKGIQEFEKMIKKTTDGVLSAPNAYFLSTVCGFPIDLTTIMAEEKGLKVDIQGFEKLCEAQSEIDRKRQKEKKTELTLGAEANAWLKNNNIKITDDSFKYQQKEVQTTVKAIWNGKEFVDTVPKGQLCGIVLESTNFYPEQGGQIYDVGQLSFVDDQKTAFDVKDCKVFGGYVLHIGYLSYECTELKVGDKVESTVDYTRRSPIMSNHTSTHMVNYALKSVLGEGIEQRGSFVDASRFRFDFSFGRAVTKDELAKIDQIVNDLIFKQLNVYAQEVPLAKAKTINGLRAVFGEVYPDPVRVVSVGVPVDQLIENPTNAEWANYSIEFCGGTHLTNTKQAELFTIISEETLGAGVRRIVAVTGSEATAAHELNKELELRFNKALKLTGSELSKEIVALLETLKSSCISQAVRYNLVEAMKELQSIQRVLAKEVENLQILESSKITERIIQELTSKPSELYVDLVNLGSNTTVITDTIKKIQAKSNQTAVMLISPDEEKGKVTCIGIVPKDSPISKSVAANVWVSKVTEVLGGKGGGKAEVAQGVGSKLDKIDEAILVARDFAK